MKVLSFFAVAVTCLVSTQNISAQEVAPRSFCGTTTTLTRSAEIERAQGRCTRANERVSVLTARVNDKNAKETAALNALADRYGTVIATCGRTFVGTTSGTPQTACAGLSSRELTRADRWAREYIRITQKQSLRDSEFDADVFEVTQACGYVSQLQLLRTWRNLACGLSSAS